MDSPAFAINGMFSAAKLGKSSFAGASAACEAKAAARSGTVVMAVDAFQKKFQTFGKIGIDYSRPKKLASYKRGGFDAAKVEYPNAVSMAGKYSIASCGKTSGSSKILMKYDEYCAKGMLQVFKRSAIPFGVYTSKCTEATQPGVAFDKRVFNRTMAFRQSQKPINVRLGEMYEARSKAFILTNGCHREEQQFKEMPMSTATFLAGKHEALGTCFRTVTPNEIAEDYMASGIRMQLLAKANKSGVYGIGACMEGFAKGEAEGRRVAALASEFRALQQSPAAVTGQAYESSRMAVKLYAQACHHEQEQLFKWPATAAAFCRY